LNARKGPSLRATRAQADRNLYKSAIRGFLENQPNLTLFQQAVNDLIVRNDRVEGVVTQVGLEFYAPRVVLTVGTFLGGRIHIGLSNYQGGRAGQRTRRAPARPAVPRRPPQDRHTAAHRRPYPGLLEVRGPARR